jgi:hypothetical protein
MKVEEPDELFTGPPGRRRIASYYLLKNLKPGLIHSARIMSGVRLKCAFGGPHRRDDPVHRNREVPLTGGFGEAEAGGYWGPELNPPVSTRW